MVDFDFLECEGFVIGQKIKRLGWKILCLLDLLTYPNLVQEFFGNMKSRDRIIDIEAQGIHIILDAD